MTSLPAATNDTIEGTPGADRLVGFGGNDLIYGGKGGDLFFEGLDWIGPADEPPLGFYYNFGAGNDTLRGGAGWDTLSYEGRAAPLTLDLSQGKAMVAGETDLFSGIEAFRATDGHDTVIFGTQAAKVVLGKGQDVVVGLSDGADVRAGRGADRLDLSAETASLSVDLSTGNVAFGDGAFTARVAGITQVVGSTTADNDLTGNALDNRLVGGSASDQMSGGGGNDTLIGGDGSNQIEGGAGNDLIKGGAGVDVIDGGLGNDKILSGGGDDQVRDMNGSNHVFLGGGADVFTGQGTVVGGQGADSFHISGTGLYRGGDGGDRFEMSGHRSSRMHGGAGDDWFVTRFKGAFQGEIYGGTGHDSLNALGGEFTVVDSIQGWAGISGIVVSVENIYLEGWSTRVSLYGSNLHVSGDDTGHEVSVQGENNTVILNEGDDVVGIDSATADVQTRGGDDRISVLYQSGSTIDTGAGRDEITLNAGAHVNAGTGADRLTIMTNPDWQQTVIDMGGQADVVSVQDSFAFLDLGRGNDTLTVDGQSQGEIRLGHGADEIIFTSFAQNVAFTVQDFDTSEDRFRLDGISGVADLASVEAHADGVLITLGNSWDLSTLVLEGLDVADITDALFL